MANNLQICPAPKMRSHYLVTVQRASGVPVKVQYVLMQYVRTYLGLRKSLLHSRYRRSVEDEWAGWAIAHPNFSKPINPFSSKGGRLCPPEYYLPTHLQVASYSPEIHIHFYTKNAQRRPYADLNLEKKRALDFHSFSRTFTKANLGNLLRAGGLYWDSGDMFPIRALSDIMSGPEVRTIRKPDFFSSRTPDF